MNKLIKILIGVFISGIFLYFSFRNFDFNSLTEIMAGASWGWIFLSFFIYGSGYIFRSYRWKILLKPITRISALEIFPILVSGFFMNNILPARGGEVFRAMALKHRQKCDVLPVLTSIALERMTDLIGTMLVLLFALPLLPRHLVRPGQILTAGAALMAILGACYFFSDFLKGHIRRHSKFEKILKYINQIKLAIGALKSKRSVGMLLILTVAVVLVELFNILNLGHALNIDLSIKESAAVMVGLIMGVAIPGAPGAVGTFEFFGKQVLMRLGYTPNDSLAFVLLLHFFYISSQALMGLTYLFQLTMDKNSEKRRKEANA